MQRFLASISVRNKLAVIVALFMCVIGIFSWQLLSRWNNELAFSQKELAGTGFYAPTYQLIKASQLHRGASLQFAKGDTAASQLLEKAAADINASLIALGTQEKRYSDIVPASQLQAILAQWTAIQRDRNNYTADQVFAEHSKLIDQILAYTEAFTDGSNLTLDPELNTFYLMNLGSFTLPHAIEQMARLRGIASAALQDGTITDAQHQRLVGVTPMAMDKMDTAIKAALKADQHVSVVLHEKVEALIQAKENFANDIKTLIDTQRSPLQAAQLFAEGTLAIDAAYALTHQATIELQNLLQKRIETMARERLLSILFLTLSISLAIILTFFIAQAILRTLRQANQQLGHIQAGDLERNIVVEGSDELAELLRGIAAMQTGLREAREREQQTMAEIKRMAEENLRVRIALDNSSTNTMIADNQNNIIYMNRSMHAMMQDAEQDLQRDLPGFAARNLMSANIDVFHRNPAHQRGIISNLRSTHRAEVKVGGRIFRLTANPVSNANGERLGTVVEWLDRTQEVRVEQEVENLVHEAARGNFSYRIDEAGKQGFFASLASGLNRMVQTANTGLLDVARMLSAMARGELGERIEADYEGIFLQVKNDANATAEKLTEVISAILEASHTVSSGAEQIAAGNADLSQRTEEQASSLEQTAASMEEITGTVKQTGSNAQHANSLSEDTVSQAEAGGDVVRRAVAAMTEINTASKRIADIIGVIDEIAFQTNLLALNAAVEAARAGEQGRGFAVVAAEVRSLAQRSAGAAKEIKTLIQDSVVKVESGADLVQATGKTFDDIVGSIRNMSKMIADINNAAREQATSIVQINQAVSQMDEMTQQNAALVEQATAAGEAMAEQARGLSDLMAFFQVERPVRQTGTNSADSAIAIKRAIKPAGNAQKAGRISRPARTPPTRATEEWEDF